MITMVTCYYIYIHLCKYYYVCVYIYTNIYVYVYVGLTGLLSCILLFSAQSQFHLNPLN